MKKLHAEISKEPQKDSVSEIRTALRKLNLLEKKGSKEVLKWKIRIGRCAQLEKDRLDEKGLAFRPFVKQHFQESINRIYEALAINRAISEGVSKYIGTTALIKIGQGMEAKDEAISGFYKEVVNNKSIKVGKKKIKLKGSNKKEILAALRTKFKKKDEPELPKQLDEKMKELRTNFAQLNQKQKEEIASKVKRWISLLKKFVVDSK